MKIKEQFKNTEKLYHFTSFDTALKIIESNSLRFGRLNNMNDIHENDKIIFVDGNNKSIDKLLPDIPKAMYDEIYKYRQISLTADYKKTDKEGFDLHQMWGLYANKSEGVCLVLDKKELEKSLNTQNIKAERVNYDHSTELESFVISRSQNPNEVPNEIKKDISDIFFHKRKEWEHEQEYRLIKRCPNANKEEYFPLDKALKFVILSSRFRNTNEVLYFQKIDEIIKKVGEIPVLIYGNGLLNYNLCTEDGKEELWNSNDKYNTVVIGENADLDIE